MSLENLIENLVARSMPITVEALGGIQGLTDSSESPLFPYVATALIRDWDSFDGPERGSAVALVSTAVASGLGGLALAETCQVIVPAAPDLTLTIPIRDALRVRVSDRVDDPDAATAGLALRWLAYLAVLSDAARPALLDALTTVGHEREPLPFAVPAAQVAALAYDHWRDNVARDCIGRLVNTSGEADAWFSLGQVQLLDSLEATDRASCIAGLGATVEYFDAAAGVGEQRPDARLFGHAVRFAIAWASDASKEMLFQDYEAAHLAFGEYVLHGRGLEDQPMWLRPRYETETAWIELLQTMNAAADSAPDGTSWYEPAVAIGALADVYRSANSFRPRRTATAGTAHGFADLVAPTIAAPFVEDARRAALVERWLADTAHPEAQGFAEVVWERVGGVVSPKPPPPGSTRR